MNKTNKEKDLNISGRIVPVNFGINYFYKYFLEATGIDLIAQGLIDVNTVKVFDYTAGFIYAGHKAHCSLKKTECNISSEDAMDMIYSMSEKDATEMLTECLALMAGKTVDELKNGTTQAAKRSGRVTAS